MTWRSRPWCVLLAVATLLTGCKTQGDPTAAVRTFFEQIRDGQTADAHAEAVTRLLEDPEGAARMGAAGRAAFVDGLGFEVQARALTSLYAGVLGP